MKIKKTLLFICMFLLAGCQDSHPTTKKFFALDTSISITVYDQTSKSILNQCQELCKKYEMVFSSHNEDSELYKINHSSSKLSPQKISQPLKELIKKGLYYAKISQGTFDLTIGSVSSLWDFQSENPQPPKQGDINDALQYVGYQKIQLHNDEITFLNQKTMIDLGAIAKGYIADQIKEYLLSQNIKSALINLGGNILCVGKKNNEKFYIGITDPQNVSRSILGVSTYDQSIVTSGIYERNFTYQGHNYHHILNPKTGYSYENQLSSVTILSHQSLEGDCLSTMCYTLGKDKGLEYINSQKGIEAIFIDRNNKIYYSQHAKEYIKTDA